MGPLILDILAIHVSIFSARHRIPEIHMDVQDTRDRTSYPGHPLQPCSKPASQPLFRVKRFQSRLWLPKLINSPTSMPVAFR
jgi:hypothetical protein